LYLPRQSAGPLSNLTDFSNVTGFANSFNFASRFTCKNVLSRGDCKVSFGNLPAGLFTATEFNDPFDHSLTYGNTVGCVVRGKITGLVSLTGTGSTERKLAAKALWRKGVRSMQPYIRSVIERNVDFDQGLTIAI